MASSDGDSLLEFQTLSINPNLQFRVGAFPKPNSPDPSVPPPYFSESHQQSAPPIPPPSDFSDRASGSPSNIAAFYGVPGSRSSALSATPSVDTDIGVSPLLNAASPRSSAFATSGNDAGSGGAFTFTPAGVGGQITSFINASLPATLAVFSSAFSAVAFAISSAHVGLPVAVHFGDSDDETDPRDLSRITLTSPEGGAAAAVRSSPSRLALVWNRFWSDPISSSRAYFVVYQSLILGIIYITHRIGAPLAVTSALTVTWAAVLVGNLLLALFLPGVIAREFLRRCARGSIVEAARVGHGVAGRRRGGRVVVLKGRVALPSSSASASGALGATGGGSDGGEMGHLDTDQGFIVMNTSLQSYHSRRAAAFYRRREHIRQTLAVDFQITDHLQDSLVVCGRRAADKGKLAAFVAHSTVVALPSSKRIIGFLDATWLEQEQRFLDEHPELQPADLVISRGMILEGQTVSVMGLLRENQPLEEDGETIRSSPWSTAQEGMVLEPLPGPVNVARFLLFWGFFPVFFPTWVSGLLISDNQGVF